MALLEESSVKTLEKEYKKFNLFSSFRIILTVDELHRQSCLCHVSVCSSVLGLVTTRTLLALGGQTVL